MKTFTFTQEEILRMLVDWDQTINPEAYKDSEELCSADFCDAALSYAIDLDLEDEYLELKNKRMFE